MLRPGASLLLCVLAAALAGCGGAPAANIEATIAAGVAATQAAAQPTIPPEPTAPPAGGRWQVLNDTSSFDDSETVVLTLAAEDAYTESWLGQSHRPILLLRCRERRTEAFIDVGFAPKVETGLLDKGRARIRVDQGEARTEFMSKSTDGEALFFDTPLDIIAELERAERLLFGYTPINADPVETSFDVRGLSDLLPQLRAACPPVTAAPRPSLTPAVTPYPDEERAVTPPLVTGLAGTRRLWLDPGVDPNGPRICGDARVQVVAVRGVQGQPWYQVEVIEAPPCQLSPPVVAVGDTGWLGAGALEEEPAP